MDSVVALFLAALGERGATDGEVRQVLQTIRTFPHLKLNTYVVTQILTQLRTGRVPAAQALMDMTTTFFISPRILQYRALLGAGPVPVLEIDNLIERKFIVHGHQISWVGFTSLHMLRKHYLISASDDGSVKLWFVRGHTINLIGYLVSEISHHSRIIDLAVTMERYVIAMWMNAIVVWTLPNIIESRPKIYHSTQYISSKYLRTSNTSGKKSTSARLNKLEKLITVKETPLIIVQSSMIIFLVNIETGDAAILLRHVTARKDDDHNQIVWACINSSCTELAILWVANGLPFVSILRVDTLKSQQIGGTGGLFSLEAWKCISIDEQTLIDGELCGREMRHIAIEAPQTEWALSSALIFPCHLQYSPNDLLLVVSFHNMSCLIAYSTAEYRKAMSDQRDQSCASHTNSAGQMLLPFIMVRNLRPWCLTIMSMMIVSYCEANSSYWSCSSFFFSPDSRYIAAQVKCTNAKYSKNYLVFYDLTDVYTYLTSSASLSLLEQQLMADEVQDKAKEFPLGVEEQFVERKILPVSRVILSGCGFGISITCLELPEGTTFCCDGNLHGAVVSYPYLWVASDTVTVDSTTMRLYERNNEEIPVTISPLDLFLFFISPDGSQNVHNIRMPCSSLANDGLVFSDICVNQATGELYVSNSTGQIMSVHLNTLHTEGTISPQEQFMYIELPSLFEARYDVDGDDDSAKPGLTSMFRSEHPETGNEQMIEVRGSGVALNVTAFRMFNESKEERILGILQRGLTLEYVFSNGKIIIINAEQRIKQLNEELKVMRTGTHHIVSIHCVGKIENILRYTLHEAIMHHTPDISVEVLEADCILQLTLNSPKYLLESMVVYDTIQYLANYGDPFAICSFYGAVYSIPARVEEKRKAQQVEEYYSELAAYYKKVQKYAYSGFYESVTSTQHISKRSYLDLGVFTPRCAHTNAMILCQTGSEFLLDRASSRFFLLENVTTLKDIKQRENMDLVSELLDTSEPLFATDVTGFLTHTDLALQTKKVVQVDKKSERMRDNSSPMNDDTLEMAINHIEAVTLGLEIPRVPRRIRNRKRLVIPGEGEDATTDGAANCSALSLSSLGTDKISLETEYSTTECSSSSSSSEVSQSTSYSDERSNKRRSAKDDNVATQSRPRRKSGKNAEETDSFVASNSDLSESGSEYESAVTYSIDGEDQQSDEKDTRPRVASTSKAEPPLKKPVYTVSCAATTPQYTRVLLKMHYDAIVRRNVEFMHDFMAAAPLTTTEMYSYAVPQVGDAIIVHPAIYRYSLQFFTTFFSTKIIAEIMNTLDHLIDPPPDKGFYRDNPANMNNKPYLGIINNMYPYYCNIDKGRRPYNVTPLTLLTISVRPIANLDDISPLVTPDYDILSTLFANERTKNTYNMQLTKTHDLLILPLSRSILLEPRNPIPEFTTLPYFSGVYHLRTAAKVLGTWIKHIRREPYTNGTLQITHFTSSSSCIRFDKTFYNKTGLDYCDLLTDILLEECLNYKSGLTILSPEMIKSIQQIRTMPEGFPYDAYHRKTSFQSLPEYMRHPEKFRITTKGNIVYRGSDDTDSESKASSKVHSRESESSTSGTTQDETDASATVHKKGELQKRLEASMTHMVDFINGRIRQKPYFYSPKALPPLLLVSNVDNGQGEGRKRWDDAYVPHLFGLLYGVFIETIMKVNIISLYSVDKLYTEYVLTAFFPNSNIEKLTKQQMKKINLVESRSYLFNICRQLYRDNVFAMGLYYFTEDLSVPPNIKQQEILASILSNVIATSSTILEVDANAEVFGLIEDLFIRDTDILTYVPPELLTLSFSTQTYNASPPVKPGHDPLLTRMLLEIVPCGAYIEEGYYRNHDFSFEQVKPGSLRTLSLSDNSNILTMQMQIVESLLVKLTGRPAENAGNTRRVTRKKKPITLNLSEIFNPLCLLSRMRLFVLFTEAVGKSVSKLTNRHIFLETFANPCGRIKRYASKIARPMWFNVIMRRIATGYYLCLQSLVNDIRIVEGNWDCFNKYQTDMCIDMCEKVIDNLSSLIIEVTGLSEEDATRLSNSLKLDSLQGDEAENADLVEEQENESSSSTDNSGESESEGSTSSDSTGDSYNTSATDSTTEWKASRR